MRRSVLLMLLGMVLTVCLGCGQERLARGLLVQSTWRGKASQQFAGSPESLKRSREIDEYRRFPVADGTQIAVWVIKARAGAGAARRAGAFPRGTVVVLHGMGESKASYLSLGRGLAAKGFDVVLMDLRTHGASTGNYVTYGFWERVDVKTVVDELISENIVSRRVYAFGMSLGASTAIQYAAISSKCKGVIAVAPFQDAYSICREKLWYLKKDKFEQVLKRAGQMGRFIVEDASAIEAVRVMSYKPIVIIHGKMDRTVPYSHGQAVFNAAEQPKNMITVGWGWHSLTTLGGTDGMIKHIEDLDVRARLFERRSGQPATTRPKAPPLPPETIKPPAAPPIPATKPAVPVVPVAPPTTKPAVPVAPTTIKPLVTVPPPATKPAVPVVPPAPPIRRPPAPITTIPIKPFSTKPKAPTSRPTIEDLLRATTQPAKPKIPTSIPTIRPLVPTATRPAAPTSKPATPYRPFRAP